MKYQFVQPIYYYYEIEANSLAEAYDKTEEIHPNHYYDRVIGGWEDCTPEVKNKVVCE